MVTFTQTHSEKPFCQLTADKANLLYLYVSIMEKLKRLMVDASNIRY